MLTIKNDDPLPNASMLKPSRYNLSSQREDDSLVIVNTFSGGAVVVAPKDRVEAVRLLKSGTNIQEDPADPGLAAFVEAGILVPADRDELRSVRYLQAHITSSATHQHLIVFPTEQCNFRCVYCYETFKKGAMTPEVREAVKAFVRRRMRSLESLAFDWFGGEPLVAFDVIADIMPEVRRVTAETGCQLTSHITTNAYLLTPNIIPFLLDWGVNSFQITVDGPKQEHNQRRLLHVIDHKSPCGVPQQPGLPISTADAHSCGPVNRGTFDTIMENVASLLSDRRFFHVCIRANYDLESLPSMDRFICDIADLVKQDPRVRIDFCPIWTDPDSVTVSVPMGTQRQKTYASLMKLAHSRGLQTDAPNFAGPSGLVCYAAKANSLVIRSDGTLNKCTVALDADYNHVGRLLADGSLDVDLDRMAKWTNSGMETDSVCQNCSVSPACQGNACPLERFENGKRPCPPLKLYPSILTPLVVGPAPSASIRS